MHPVAAAIMPFVNCIYNANIIVAAIPAPINQMEKHFVIHVCLPINCCYNVSDHLCASAIITSCFHLLVAWLKHLDPYGRVSCWTHIRSHPIAGNACQIGPFGPIID